MKGNNMKLIIGLFHRLNLKFFFFDKPVSGVVSNSVLAFEI